MADTSVGPAKIYEPLPKGETPEDVLIKQAPLAVRKAYDKIKTNTAGEKAFKIYTKWLNSPATKKKIEALKAPIRKQPAIGVFGERVYDTVNNKFLGYTSDTRFTQYLPKKGAEAEQYALSAQYSSPGNIPVQAPRYYEGDQIKPSSDMNPQQRADLQEKMKAAHLYEGGYVQGGWNDVDIAAYSKALAGANQTGITVEEWLEEEAKRPKMEDEDANIISLNLASPEHIKQVATVTAKEIYGGALPQHFIDEMVTAFHERQMAAQTAQQYTQTVGGAAVDEVPLDTFMEQQIKERYPNEVGATSFGNAFDKILGTFTNPVA